MSTIPVTPEALALALLVMAAFAFTAGTLWGRAWERTRWQIEVRKALGEPGGTPLRTMLDWSTEIGNEYRMPDVHTTQNDAMIAEIEDEMRAEFRPSADGGSRADRPLLAEGRPS